MQTFLPFNTFHQSAECLDNKRLGKQRVECIQILNVLMGVKTGWKNHPAVKMWKGYEHCLMVYTMVIISEWKRRGYKDTCMDKLFELIDRSTAIDPMASLEDISPPWLHDERVIESHRSNLMRKNPEHYSQYFDTPDNLPYAWPVMDETYGYTLKYKHSVVSKYAKINDKVL